MQLEGGSALTEWNLWVLSQPGLLFRVGNSAQLLD
jgi:hypothetical protein